MIDGVIVVDKPKGLTSFGVVKAVRKVTGVKKVGHAGTLDPMATGVLPVCVGKATKIVQFLMAGHKEYLGMMRLGVVTDTYDAEGEILETTPLGKIGLSAIQAAVSRFTGSLLQSPPPYSAVKHKGEPLYRLARRGEVVRKEPRQIHVFAFTVESWHLPFVEFRVSCTKGTYVRSLVHDIGAVLGCGAHLCSLRRLRSGPFSLEEAVDLETIGEAASTRTLGRYVMPVSEALAHIPSVVIDQDLAAAIRNGRRVSEACVMRLMETQGLRRERAKPFLRLVLPSEGGAGREELVTVLEWGGGDQRHDRGQSGHIRPLKIWQNHRKEAV